MMSKLLPLFFAVATGFVVAGCTSVAPSPPVPLSASAAANDFAARSLHDDGLTRFLQENLGRVPTESWDFEALSWVAFYYHPSLAVARAQWATARAAQQTATQRPNPTLSLTPGYNTTRTPGVSPWFPSINFDFLLPTNGKRARQQDIARAEAEAARLAVVTTVWQVRTELRRALADAAIGEQRAALLQTQATVQHHLLTLLNERLAAGSIAALEVSTARSAWLRAESSAADAHSVAATSRARVAAAVGLTTAGMGRVILPVPPVAPTLLAEALTVATRDSLQSRSDILAALAKYESAQAALDLEVAKQFPDIHLGPGYQWDQGNNKWSIALTFELPLFHRNEAPIAEAVARRAEAAAQFVSIQAQALAAIEGAAAAQSAAASQLERAHGLQVESAQQGQQARQRVELGASDEFELQTTQLDVATTAVAALDAEFAAAQAAGQLEDALQVPFPHLAALAEAARTPSSRRP